MSLLPLLLSTWWADFGYPLAPNLGLATLPQPGKLFPHTLDHYYPFVYDRGVLDFYKPWLSIDNVRKSSVFVDDNTFKVIIDVQQFKPEEVSVKVVDRFLVVKAKQEEKRDEYSSISRQFMRKYLLLDRADTDQLKSTISSDGILTITAPLKPKESKDDEKVIEIEFTGQPALRPTEDENRTSEASTTVTEGKKVEDNEIREEMTTQAQQETVKPEK